MYSEDPRNRKAPSLLLGFIAITGALILALFLTGILKANADDLIEPPHDPMFNNIVFITMTNTYMYVGGDTVIDMYEGASDGQYAQVWKSNFVQAINNFFSYVPKEQCFIVVASDGASANYMTSIREVLTSVSANYWSGSQDGNFEANDFSGYEDLYAPAGMYNVRYKSRIIKYAPVSPTPSPTPAPTETISFVWQTTQYGSNVFVLVDIEASLAFGYECLNTYDPFVYLRTQYSNYSELPLLRNAIVFTKNNSANNISLYFPASGNVSVIFYDMGSTYINDWDYVRNNFPSQDMMSETSFLDVDCRLWSSNQGSFTLYSYSIRKGNWSGQPVLYNSSDIAAYEFTSSYNAFKGLDWNQSYASYCPILYGLELMTNVREDPNLPTPTASPSPSPTPTEAPHVNINWPSGTPTPTPPFSVSVNSGTGSGSSGSGSLSPGQIDSTLDTFKTYTENNNAFAFLYACTSVIPDEALYFLFILLFILLLLACIRLFVHFTG